MKRYSFGTFIVDASNREAFDLCTRVAGLQPVPALPLVLLAPPEGGKTHLLYAIANRVKATRSGTTLGFVRAGAFPDEVRRLVHDSGPIARAQRAVFLVDDAEEFIDHVDALEDVVRLFLEHGHAVVVASKLPPEYLVNLTPGLREILCGGLLVRMGSYRTESVPAGSRAAALDDAWTGLSRGAAALPPGIAEDTPEHGAPATDDVVGLRSRIRELTVELEHVRGELALRRATEEDVERYRHAVEELKERNKKSQLVIAALRQESGRASSARSMDLEKINAELGAARDAQTRDRELVTSLRQKIAQLEEGLKHKADLEADLDYLRRELAVREQVHQEHASLRHRFEALQDEHARMLARVEEAMAERDRAIVKLNEQQAVSVQRQAEAEAERSRRDALVTRMHALLEHVEQYRRRVQQEEESQDRLLDEVEQLAVERVPLIVHGVGGATHDSLESLLEDARREADREWQQRWQQLEEASHVTHERANEAAAECLRLQVAMEQREAQIRDLQQTVASLTAEKKKLSSQLESLRTEHHTALEERAKLDEEFRQVQADLEHLDQEHHELTSTLEDQRIELEMTRIALDAQTEDENSREGRRAQLEAERDAARVALEAMRSEYDRLRAQHKTAQRRLETALAELDALRHEAASQVAAAHAQAGDLERRLASLQEQHHHAAHAGQSVAKELRELEQRFIETAEFVSRMSERLALAAERDAGDAESAYLYALTRGEHRTGEQLPLDMPHRESSGNTSADEGAGKGPGNPYDDDKFIPFKPAEHKINRTV